MKRVLFSLVRWTVIGLVVAAAGWLKLGFWSLLAIVVVALFINSLMDEYLRSVFLSPHASFTERPWEQYTITVPPYVLHLQLPTGESRDFWSGKPVVERADPNDASAYDSTGQQRLLEKYWDDPQVRSSLMAGTAMFCVVLCRVPPETPEDVTQRDGLAKYLARTIREYYEEESPDSEPPRSYKPITISGKQWLAYDSPAKANSSVYAIPLGLHTYLRLHFNRISTGPRPEWVADADALRDCILSKVVLEDPNVAAIASSHAS